MLKVFSLKALTDEQLMRAAANGDLDMLGVLFERHHVKVYNFLYKTCGNKMLSEDITQEVFYNLIKYRTTYKYKKFMPWLFTIARNSLRSNYRADKERHAGLDTVAYKLIVNEDDDKEAYSQLHEAINELNLNEKEIIVLNRLHEIKYNELAQIIGSTPGAVKTKVSRVLKKLRAIYFEKV